MFLVARRSLEPRRYLMTAVWLHPESKRGSAGCRVRLRLTGAPRSWLLPDRVADPTPSAAAQGEARAIRRGLRPGRADGPAGRPRTPARRAQGLRPGVGAAALRSMIAVAEGGTCATEHAREPGGEFVERALDG